MSPNGLILTNHHVAFGALQRTSTAEHNYIADGFNAASFEEEIPAPGYRASVLVSIEDVTRKVLSAVTDSMGDLERFNAIEKRIKEIVKYGEEGRDVECRVVSFYEGMQYKLFTYFVCKDVRIVYAPPESIGNYGGDIDNWMWPRHTGDFSFLRAYVAPNGKSAEYAKENVPYKPAVYLADVDEGRQGKRFHDDHRLPRQDGAPRHVVRDRPDAGLLLSEADRDVQGLARHSRRRGEARRGHRDQGRAVRPDAQQLDEELGRDARGIQEGRAAREEAEHRAGIREHGSR